MNVTEALTMFWDLKIFQLFKIILHHYVTAKEASIFEEHVAVSTVGLSWFLCKKKVV